MKIRQILERTAGPWEIEWVPARSLGDSYTIVWVDVARVDASWQGERDFYVGPGGSHNAIKGRYARFDEFVRTGVPIQTPEFGLNYKGEATFGNGRHRFAWMRDHGVTALPVLVNKEDAPQIVAKFGTSEHHSFVTKL